jgi:hypothetical protein
VGEITSIIENVVIIKGLASEVANRGSRRALDSDTLLVFEDRKVVGYVRTSCDISFQISNRDYRSVKLLAQPLSPSTK